VYYLARDAAMSNGHQYHVAAVLIRNRKIVRVGTNTMKTHPRFVRMYPDGSCAAHMHAEMDVLRFAQPGDELEVMRFRKDGSLGMSKPCKFCQRHIQASGIRRVHYTDETGARRLLGLRKEAK